MKPQSHPNPFVPQTQQKFAAFNWNTDKDKPKEQLFGKAFRYCTQYLGLSHDLFTQDMELFGAYKSEINLSGGMEWHSPPYSLVLGLSHNLEPENMDDYILLYHGVKNNSYFREIFKSRLKAGPGQAYKGQKSRNPNMTVPFGIYGSQYISVTMGYVDHSFPMVLQIATPKAVMTTSKNIFVIQQGTVTTPIKLVFPFAGVDRSDQFK